MITIEQMLENPVEGFVLVSTYARVVSYMALNADLYDFADDEDVRDVLVEIASEHITDEEVEALLQMLREIQATMEIPSAA